MEFEFESKIWVWRESGPRAWYFITVPAEPSRQLRALSSELSAGWGMIRGIEAQLGNTKWKTGLSPQDDLYMMPIKAAVRKAENLSEGDTVKIRITVPLA